MNLFIHEYISAGGLGPEAPPSLRAEGRAMLAALAEDFSRVPGVQVHTLLAESVSGSIGNHRGHVEFGAEQAAFQEMTAGADWVLVIAPEFAGILAERSRWVLEAGKKLLGSQPGAIELTADKHTLARHWARHGIATPPTYLLADNGAAEQRRCPCPAICKPRRGAGSQATFLVDDPASLASIRARARAEMPGDDFVLQPFASGQPASVTFFMGPKQRLALKPAAQVLSADGRFHYQGGRVPLAAELAERALILAERAVATVVGLSGMVGVDLVLGAEIDGSADVVIEINPRPTTSYIGLRRLARDNLAETLLRVIFGEEAPHPRWRAGPVEFGVGGSTAQLYPIRRSPISPLTASTIFGTAYLALACWAGSQWLGTMNARLLWTIGAAANLAHVLLAFHFVHHWDQDLATAAVARQTFARTGIDSGIGLYVNYAFTTLWLADAALWWLWPARHAHRSRRTDAVIQVLFLFMFFNATVVFGTSPRWIIGLILCLVGAVGWLCTKKRAMIPLHKPKA